MDALAAHTFLPSRMSEREKGAFVYKGAGRRSRTAEDAVPEQRLCDTFHMQMQRWILLPAAFLSLSMLPILVVMVPVVQDSAPRASWRSATCASFSMLLPLTKKAFDECLDVRYTGCLCG